MRTTSGLTSALLTLLLISQTAQAQFVAPMRYNEGPGLKLSDSLVFHPGIALEGRYDSNVFYSEKNISGAPYMRILGHLHLATLPPQRLTDGEGNKSKQMVEFRLKAALGFREYFSDNSRVKDQRALEIDSGLVLKIMPQSVFSVSITDDYVRSVTAPNREFSGHFDRDTNRARLGFKLTPGGGRLVFDLGYAFNVDIFENSELARLNKVFHEIDFVGRWKLLPKSAVFLQVIQQFIGYTDPTAGGDADIGYTNVDSSPFRVYLGYNGLFTARLSTLLKVGYGNSIHSSGTSYNMMLGQAELGYQFSPFAKLRLGFLHDFYDSLLANYFTDEKIYLLYDHMIASRFLIHVSGDYRYRSHGGFEAISQASELSSHVITLGLGFDYQIMEWIYVGVGYDLQLNKVINGPQLSSFFANDYSKHQVFGKVGVSY